MYDDYCIDDHVSGDLNDCALRSLCPKTGSFFYFAKFQYEKMAFLIDHMQSSFPFDSKIISFLLVIVMEAKKTIENTATNLTQLFKIYHVHARERQVDNE